MTTRKAFFAFVACSAMVFSAEDLAQWSYHKDIVFNTKASGAQVPSTQANVPVVIRLSVANSDVFTGALPKGADIRFTNAAGVRLPYEIEMWDNTNKKAVLWVLADSVKGNDSLVGLKMYWGKAGAADSSNREAVFDTAHFYESVWHMNEAANDTLRDATKNRFKAVPMNTGNTGMPKDTLGMIGQGKFFNGNSANSAGNFYTILNSASGKLNFLKNQNFCIAAWAYCDMLDAQFRMVVCKHDNQYTLSTKPYTSGTQWEFNVYTDRGWEDVYTPATGKKWVYLVGMRKGMVSPAQEALYVDGALAVGTIQANGGGGAQNTGTNVLIGAMPPTQRYWNGMIDEVQMMSTIINPDRIKLNYENQKYPQTLVVLGLTQATTAAKNPQSAFGREIGTVVTLRIRGGQAIEFRVPEGSGEYLRLHIMDLQGRAVWSKTIGRLADKGCEIVWDARSGIPKRSASGIYIARLLRTGKLAKAGSVLDKKISVF